MHALISDDDDSNRTMLRRMLARQGWSAEEVIDGQAAVEACVHNHFDLVLLDIHMPGISGREAARLIRSNHEAKAEPKPRRPWLVAVTGAARDSKEEYAAFDAYLQKPFMLGELSACLDSLLSGNDC